MQYIRLFPKIIGFIKNENHNLIKDKLINKCFSIKEKISKGGNNWLSDVYNVSGKINLYNIKEFKPLLKWIDEKVLQYTNNLNIDFKINKKNGWFQIYNENDYQEIHTHPTSKISAVYYLKGNENSSPLFFTDFNFCNIHFKISKYTEDNSSEWNIPFQEGVLLIFRSDLPHCVPKNKSKERISIAINYY